jgi:hypothetical protein
MALMAEKKSMVGEPADGPAAGFLVNASEIGVNDRLTSARGL